MSEALDKTVITDNWKFFLKKLFQHFTHHEKILKVTKFQFKIICRSKVLDTNIPLWYIEPPPPHSTPTHPGSNKVKWWYCHHSKTWSNMFSYFYFGWIFSIIFTTINLFYKTFKICINNKSYFIRILVLIKL